MHIYIPIYENDPRDSKNPYVYSLVTAMLDINKKNIFSFGIDLFWSEKVFDVDVIHIMWPDFLIDPNHSDEDLKKRLVLIKNKGVKLVSTCHNLTAHTYGKGKSSNEYEIVYSLSDLIIHLEEYSYSLFVEKYDNIKNALIPHHVYNNLKYPIYEREIAIKALSLDKRYKYILCFGAFRNSTERDIVKTLAKEYKKREVRFIAPSIVYWPKRSISVRAWLGSLCEYLDCKLCGVITSGRYVSEREMPYYYAASDMCFIHRPSVLNSGNLPLAMYLRKVVVGPNVGNVGCILKKTGNPSYNPLCFSSLVNSIDEGLYLAERNFGIKNYEYCQKHYLVEIIAKKILTCYEE